MPDQQWYQHSGRPPQVARYLADTDAGMAAAAQRQQGGPGGFGSFQPISAGRFTFANWLKHNGLFSRLDSYVRDKRQFRQEQERLSAACASLDRLLPSLKHDTAARAEYVHVLGTLLTDCSILAIYEPYPGYLQNTHAAYHQKLQAALLG